MIGMQISIEDYPGGLVLGTRRAEVAGLKSGLVLELPLQAGARSRGEESRKRQ